MNIEHLHEAVGATLKRQIDDTIWDRFARCGNWEFEVVELIAQLFEETETDIAETLSEIDADETEDPTSPRDVGVSDVGGTDTTMNEGILSKMNMIEYTTLPITQQHYRKD
jgi:hypothetical protein